MKIIIAYASAGAGHLKAAQSLYNYFRAKNSNLELVLVDALDYSSRFFKYGYIYSYNFMVRYAPWLWALVFYLTRMKLFYFFIRTINAAITRLNAKRFCKFLISENAEAIISTHFLPSEISARLKQKGRIRSRTITVITDFDAHPFWLNDSMDIYVVACGFTKQQLVSAGIEEGNILDLGIPIDLRFFQQYDKVNLCAKLGLDKDKFSVLIATGSFGIGPMEEIVESLYEDVQVLAVCARNKKLFARLKKKNYPQVKVFGFVENIQELMAASDIIITKPGGLTVSEVLAMELAPIFVYAIPGQETKNLKVLESFGIGVRASCIKEVKRIVLGYKANPAGLRQVKEKIRIFKKSNPLEGIYNVVCESSLGAAG